MDTAVCLGDYKYLVQVKRYICVTLKEGINRSMGPSELQRTKHSKQSKKSGTKSHLFTLSQGRLHTGGYATKTLLVQLHIVCIAYLELFTVLNISKSFLPFFTHLFKSKCELLKNICFEENWKFFCPLSIQVADVFKRALLFVCNHRFSKFTAAWKKSLLPLIL